MNTKIDKIRSVPKKWYKQYHTTENSINFYDQKKLDIYNKLLELNSETCTCEDVNKIIGNGSWTQNTCYECNKHCDLVVEFGQEPDYESITCWVCPKCLNKAKKLIKEKYKK